MPPQSTPTREIHCNFINQLQGPFYIMAASQRKHAVRLTVRGNMRLQSKHPFVASTNKPACVLNNPGRWHQFIHNYGRRLLVHCQQLELGNAKDCSSACSLRQWTRLKMYNTQVTLPGTSNHARNTRWQVTSHAPTWAPVFWQLLTTALGDKGTATLAAKTHASSCGAACVKGNIN